MKVFPRKLPSQPLTEAEVQQVLRAFPRSWTGRRNRLIALFLYRSGLRCSELLELVPDDIDYEHRAVLVKYGKGGKSRRVGICQSVLDLVKMWLPRRPQNAIRLFCTKQGGRIDASYLRRVFTRIGKAANITKRVHPHQCRHTFAMGLANLGLDLRIIQKALGHSNLAITHVYLDHMTDTHVISAVNSVDWSLNRSTL